MEKNTLLFKIGDTVRLKSNEGPNMTVTAHYDNEIETRYFIKHTETFTKVYFPPDALMLVALPTKVTINNSSNSLIVDGTTTYDAVTFTTEMK